MAAFRVIFLSVLMILVSYNVLGTGTSENPSVSYKTLQRPSTCCKLHTSRNYNLNIQNLFDKKVDLIYLKWNLRYDDEYFGTSKVNSYLQQENVIIDPFVWVLSRSKSGLELLSYPFDYRMLSLGTLESGVSKVAPFQVIIPKGEAECFRRAPDSDRLHMLAELFLSTTFDVIKETSKQSSETPSICVEKHSRRSPSVADMYLGTHIALQVSSSYLCWTTDAKSNQLAEFEVQLSTPWLRSIIKLEPTWYLLSFVLMNLIASVYFVSKCRHIGEHIERSDAVADTFVRCARFLTLIHLIPTTIFIITYFDNYCKRRTVAQKFSSVTQTIDFVHFILSICIIKLPWLYRKSRRIMSRKTLLLGFFIACVFTSICINTVYVIEVLYFTIIGLIRNPKTVTLVFLQICRSVLIIRAVIDLHNFLRFEYNSNGQTLFNFLLKRAIQPASCFFWFLSLLHVCLDPYNISPVTSALLSAAVINWIWYKLAFTGKLIFLNNLFWIT